MKHIYLLSASVALLAACGNNASDENGSESGAASQTGQAANAGTTVGDSTAQTQNQSQPMPTDAAGYAAMAGAADLFEIESSKAAMAKSKSTELTKFAQMMIDHHTESTAKVKSAAKTANITLAAPELDPMQQRMLDEIKAADATAVDQVYWQHQRTAHEAALKLHQNFASSGDNAEFKTTAAAIVPVVEKHLAEIGKMKAQ